jgi:hypothetical protein
MDQQHVPDQQSKLYTATIKDNKTGKVKSVTASFVNFAGDEDAAKEVYEKLHNVEVLSIKEQRNMTQDEVSAIASSLNMRTAPAKPPVKV